MERTAPRAERSDKVMESSGPGKTKQVFRLGDFRVDPQRRIIASPAGETAVEPKVMAVLLLLADRRGEVVTRQDFLDSVWAREYGGDESLTRAVSQLRKILGDGRAVHTHIETVPRTGYRLVAPDDADEAGTERRYRGWKLAAGASMALLAVVALTQLSRYMETAGPGFSVAGQAPMLLAVLPFDSESGMMDDEGLAHGLSHEIESTLRQSPSLPVIVGRYPPQLIGAARQDLRLLNRQFNISHVIDGAVRRSTDGLRVVVRLVDIRTGREVWSDEVTRPEAELNMIPGLVANAVQVALGADPIAAGSPAAIPDPLAYEGYLQAKALARASTGETLRSAVGILERVVEMDPDFSDAWSELAWARFNLYHVAGSGEMDYGGESNRERIQAARRNANTALAIDPNTLDARLMVAVISLMEETDTLVESESRLLALLAASPNHPNVNHRMGLFLMSVGRWQEAAEVMRKALQLDPLSGLAIFNFGTALIGSDQTRELHDFLTITNSYRYYRKTYSWLLEQLTTGDFQAAREFFISPDGDNVFLTRGTGQPENIDPDSPRGLRLDALVRRLVGVTEAGNPAIDPALGGDWVQAADEGLIAYHWVALLLAAAGVNDAALDLVRERVAMGEVWYREVLLMPGFKSARLDPDIMALFDLTSQLDYWLQTGKWPDFCADPDLPYECEEAAQKLAENLTG